MTVYASATYTLSSYSDEDSGDTHTVTVTIDGSIEYPDWLIIISDTLFLNPFYNDEAGVYEFKVVVEDDDSTNSGAAPLSVEDTFTITILESTEEEEYYDEDDDYY
jgi:hypothetical protein